MTVENVIRFDNFKVQYAGLKDEIDAAVHKVLESGWFIMGQEVKAFEEEFAQYIGCRYCVGVASGTDAIALSLMALGIGVGDEVITTNMTAFPTITAIIQTGATPVVTDISYEDGLMDIDAIESKVNRFTRAIIPVHLYGQSCDMGKLIRVASKHSLHIVEDCAQSVGAKFKGKRTGSIGDLGAFSFYPTKNLGAYGDGGAITTDDENVYDKLLQLRNYGQSVRYYHDTFGVNSRLDEIQAAVLRVKLKYLDEWNEKRRNHAAFYQKNLKVPCLKQNDYGTPVYHLFIIKTKARDAMMEHLKNNGIQCLIHYPVPVKRQKAFPLDKKVKGPGDSDTYPNTAKFADEILSIPIYPELANKDREKIVKVINEFND